MGLGLLLLGLAGGGAFLALRVAWERALRLPSPQWLARAASYAIGTVAMYWVIERVLGFAT